MTKKEAKDILLKFAEKYRDDWNYSGLVQAISTYLEPIDEEKLDELAKQECHKIEANALVKGILEDTYELRGVFRGFKAGYRKAKEE